MLARYQDPSFVDGKLYQLRCSLLRWWSASSSRKHDKLRQQTWLRLLNYGDKRPDIGVISSMAAYAVGPSWGHCWRRGIAIMLTNQSADKRVQGLMPYACFALILAHVNGSCLKHIDHCRGCCMHIAYQMTVSSHSFGTALSSVSLHADRTPRLPLVPPTTILFL